MSEAILLLPLYAVMEWTGKTLPLPLPSGLDVLLKFCIHVSFHVTVEYHYCFIFGRCHFEISKHISEILTDVSRDFPQPPEANSAIMHPIKSATLPALRIPIHCSLLPTVRIAIYSVLEVASLNKRSFSEETHKCCSSTCLLLSPWQYLMIKIGYEAYNYFCNVNI